MQGDRANSQESELMDACRSLERIVSDLRDRDPDELGAAEARDVIRRLRRLKKAVNESLQGASGALPTERRKNVLRLLRRIGSACQQASSDMEACLANMRSDLSDLSAELSALRSYEGGSASRDGVKR